MNLAQRSDAFKSTKRTHVTIPNDLESLFAWYVRYDRRFEGSPAAAAAYFFRQGINSEYVRGLQEADPLDEETYGTMARSQAQALKLRQRPQVLGAGVRDLRIVEVQDAQPLQPRQVLQAHASYTGAVREPTLMDTQTLCAPFPR